MCEFCDDSKSLLIQDELISHQSWGWGNDEVKINLRDALELSYSLHVMVDRGYLRLIDPEDGDCMDHGERVKINFCPMCGRNLTIDYKDLNKRFGELLDSLATEDFVEWLKTHDIKEK